jgi:hypothetical protein
MNDVAITIQKRLIGSAYFHLVAAPTGRVRTEEGLDWFISFIKSRWGRRAIFRHSHNFKERFSCRFAGETATDD